MSIYSSGMMCYDILIGCVPFLNFKLMDLWKKIKDGVKPDIPDQCPKQLSTLVQKIGLKNCPMSLKIG